MDTQLILTALGLTTVAGLSTGIGAGIAYLFKRPKRNYLSFSLGFSAGFMIYISLVELLPGAVQDIGHFNSAVAFFVGILIMAAIDFAIPEIEDPHEFKFPGSEETSSISLMRTGHLTALAIAIHNFPEGIAVLGTSLTDLRLGVIIAIGIAMHNIPEGISVSVPFLYSTHEKKKAFLYSLLSGLAEPAGALIGLLVLLPFLNSIFLASILAFVAGIMVYISLDELLPLAHDYGESHVVIIGVFLGMFVMAMSLVLL